MRKDADSLRLRREAIGALRRACLTGDYAQTQQLGAFFH
jgi:hypothetical protein